MQTIYELEVERRLTVRILIALACLAGFVGTTLLALSGASREVDARVAHWFQSQRSPTEDHLVRELTALGGDIALTLLTLGVAGFLLAIRRYNLLALWLVSIVGARLLNVGVRMWALRPRPGPAPIIHEFDASSFPSGHAMMSMAVYLTLALLAIRLTRRAPVRVYFVTAAVVLSLAIGLSRVYLGYHHFTDVLAGWMAGIFWVSICFEAGPIRQLLRTLFDFRRWRYSRRERTA